MKTIRITSEFIAECDPDDTSGINNPLIKAISRELFPKAKKIILSRVQNKGYTLYIDGELWYPNSKTESWLDRWFAHKTVKPIHAGIRDLELP